MAQNNTISPVPNNQPMTDKSGLVSTIWSGFFNQLWSRAGGATAPSNTDLNSAINAISAINQLTGDVSAGPNAGVGPAIATIQPNVVSNSKLAQMAADSIKGNNSGSSANVSDLSPSQVTAMLDLFNSTIKGLVPASGGGTTNFLRADGTWSATPGAVSSVAMTVPSIMTISGSPITSSGTLAIGLSVQSANTFFSGPVGGSPVVPTFRAIQAVDVPTLNQNTTGTASNITATTNSSLTTLPSLSLPYSQLTGVPSFFAPTVQKFTGASGTYTLPTGPSPLYIKVTVVGAGGGGGGAGASTSAGGTGGTTTFGTSLISCGGGVGGIAGTSSTPGSGGAGGSITTSGVTILVASSGANGNPGNTTWAGGQGGSTAIGGGGAGGPSSGNGISATMNSGSGGGGAGRNPSGTVTTAGGGGGAGGYVHAIINSPASSYAYSVGASGSGGLGTLTGGPGGNGYILVEEYYK